MKTLLYIQVLIFALGSFAPTVVKAYSKHTKTEQNSTAPCVHSSDSDLAIAGISSIHRKNAAWDNQTIPHTIKIYNSSDCAIHIKNIKILPGQEGTVAADATGSFIIKQGGCCYRISYPCSNRAHDKQVSTTCHLDFTTIAWLAGTSELVAQHGLDELEIKNDTLYKIAVMYVLNKVRSLPRDVPSQESTSKVVRDTISSESTGYVEITDANKQKYTVKFPRRAISRNKAQVTDWRRLTLCAHTISLFNHGFLVSAN